MYDYYVYGHYTDDGTLFYIGKGRGDRHLQIGRNSAHDRIATRKGCNSKILFRDLSEKEALLIEDTMVWNAEEIGFILTNQMLGNNDEPLLSDQEVMTILAYTFYRKDANMNNNKSETLQHRGDVFLDLSSEVINREYEKNIYRILEESTQIQLDVLCVILTILISYSNSLCVEVSISKLSKLLDVSKNDIQKNLISFYPNLDLECKEIGDYKRFPVIKEIICDNETFSISFYEHYANLMVPLYNGIHGKSSSILEDYLAEHTQLYNDRQDILDKIN
ncbi:hypothetical protein ACWOAH_11175 [Vagococcus vulneris]|uniref:GIY-YIG domain-containing protein n=1 Tax=Vagococcus vulneris TaxID=1977869 RepID=A0A429ZR56_9ENTE|nr:hypothetical protein [Vagococcus vulneris]RST96145.1 hypothetical protein CBF37_11195 [Vagococcus vulneris]